ATANAAVSNGPCATVWNRAGRFPTQRIKASRARHGVLVPAVKRANQGVVSSPNAQLVQKQIDMCSSPDVHIGAVLARFQQALAFFSRQTDAAVHGLVSRVRGMLSTRTLEPGHSSFSDRFCSEALRNRCGFI